MTNELEAQVPSLLAGAQVPGLWIAIDNGTDVIGTLASGDTPLNQFVTG